VSSVEVWLVRHAESAWNALGRWQGHADPGLSARGRAQALTLARTLAGEDFGALVTSDLRRARETAAALASALGLEPEADARLRERDLGAWSGLTTPEIAGRWPAELARLREGDPDFRPHGGESIRDMRSRAHSYFAELATRCPAPRVAVVTHGGLIRALHRSTGPVANGTWVRTSIAALLDGLDRAAAEGLATAEPL
jgi:probable phosphoglycerate mutase